MIGVPVRDRAFIIREFLDAIDNLDYPKDRIILNLKFNNIGKKDRTPLLVRDWMKETDALSRYRFIQLGNTDFDDPPLPRPAPERHKDLIKNLCHLRNWIRMDFLTGTVENAGDKPILADYLLDLDSDQILNKGTLTRLLSHKKDIVAALTKIPYGHNVWCWNYYDYNGTNLEHKRNEVSGELEETDVVGGIVLYSRKAIEILRFKEATGSCGEDQPYQTRARKQGIEVYIDTDCDYGNIILVFYV